MKAYSREWWVQFIRDQIQSAARYRAQGNHAKAVAMLNLAGHYRREIKERSL